MTLVASVLAYLRIGPVILSHMRAGSWCTASVHALALAVIGFFIYGALVYQFTRLSFLKRRKAHRRAFRDELESVYDDPKWPSLTILVPSYREDARVVFLTLMSAVLQEHPDRRVVLLIDDPPVPSTPEDAAGLEAMRLLPQRVMELMAEPRKRFKTSLADFLARRSSRTFDAAEESVTLARLHNEAAEWFSGLERRLNLADHTEDLFARLVLDPHRSVCLARVRELAQNPPASRNGDPQWITRQYRRLAALFDVDVVSFERKAFINLSHEPNKAMNLNSYIGLIGRAFKKHHRQDSKICFLDETHRAEADFFVPDADYLITLDADSLLSPEYALRLIHHMERPGNERIAVIQTPYSAIPDAPGRLEQIAGATTDIQYVTHQGFTSFRATYWVGANALLRKAALLDIAQEENERGYAVTKYIRDRTVIEDTESSIDLVRAGWQLYNYPERLSYSATPPDFGSLIIQRRRWANGGLLIVPKLLGYLLQAGGRTFAEAFMRLHYLTSIAVVNLGLILLAATPLTEDIRTAWLAVAALPYFFLYMRDLRLNGYRNRDIVRVYALNLLLIPINLGGVFKSIHQAVTKQKIAFGRTPKVPGRTAAAPFYVLAEYVLALCWFVQSAIDFRVGWMMQGTVVLLNACLLTYAIVSFVGLRESKEDLAIGVRRWFQLLKTRTMQPNAEAVGEEAQA